MSEWVTAWDDDAREVEGGGGALAARCGGWAAGAILVAAALWFLLFSAGLATTLGSVDGSERHGRNLVRLADESSFGLPTMYARAGQRLWWYYDVTVEGAGGVRLRIARSPPSEAFIVRAKDVARSGRVRFELVAPEAGFYSFSQYLIPQGNLLGNGEAGSTRYSLRWGID